MNSDWRPNLKEILKERGISLREFSAMIGKSESYTKNMLRFGRDPALSTALDICRVLELPFTFFIDANIDDSEILAIARQFAALPPVHKETVKAVVRSLHETGSEMGNNNPVVGRQEKK